MKTTKSYYVILFLLSIFLVSFSCKSDQSKVTNDSVNTQDDEDAAGNIENPIDSSSYLEKDSKPDNVQTKQDLPANTKNENLPKGSKIAVIVSDKKEGEVNTEKSSSNGTTNIQPSSKAIDIHQHEVFDKLLKSYVSSSGKVNYRGIKTNEKALNEYLSILSSNIPVESWSRNEKMAYWINAYNAFTIKKVIDNYPLKSIKDLNGGKVWDQKFITLGNKSYSLNEIENQILRTTYKDPRIHFAVNCAAKSCPPLTNKVFTASNLNQMLDRNTKDFINDISQNKISENKIIISNIFDWYKSDFNDIIDYLNKYSTTKINKNAKITFNVYDWNLNE